VRPLDICLSGVFAAVNTLGLCLLAWLHRRTFTEVKKQGEETREEGREAHRRAREKA